MEANHKNEEQEGLPEEVTKDSIRQGMWRYIEKNRLANFPRPVYRRIPNFKGASLAADKACELDIFKEAKMIKINPDKPQEQARFNTLEAEKALLVPTPRLRHGLFNRITPPEEANKASLRICSRSQGVHEFSTPIGLEDKMAIDLVIIGSVAVSKDGHRIGKGEGFADLEWGMMSAIGAVNENTIVVTTVHECQVADIPEELMKPHDLNVDFIVTPEEIIECPSRPKPVGIHWNMLSKDKFKRVPVLRKLREMERAAGKDVTLKDSEEPDSPGNSEAEEEEREKERRQRFQDRGDGEGRRRRFKGRRPRGQPRQGEGEGEEQEEEQRENRRRGDRDDGEGRDQRRRRRFPQRRRRRRTHSGDKHEDEDHDDSKDGHTGDENEEPRRRPPRPYRRRRRFRNSRENRDSEGHEGHDEHDDHDVQRDLDGEHSGDEKGRRGGRRPRMPPRRRRGNFRATLPGVYVGALPRSLRASEFKGEVKKKDVYPTQVIWRGNMGHSFLLFETDVLVEEALNKLADLEIEGRRLKVQQSRRNQRGPNRDEHSASPNTESQQED